MLLSMVSLGILFDFAFAMSLNFALFAGSEPPSLTATAISLPSLVNIFPSWHQPFLFVFYIGKLRMP